MRLRRQTPPEISVVRWSSYAPPGEGAETVARLGRGGQRDMSEPDVLEATGNALPPERTLFSAGARWQCCENYRASYFWLVDGRIPPNSHRSRRIASHKNRMTSAIATAGAARARNETSDAPTSSAVAMNRLPIPPVQMVEFALSVAVTPCVMPAMPPPAITAAVHFTMGGTSVMTAAETTVPATNAAGVAKVSSRLSTPGM